MLKIALLIYFIGIVKGMEMLPEMPVVEYFNPKYFQFMNLTAGRQSRRSPYYLGVHIKSLTEVGNNVTISAIVNEYLSGRYHPTPIYMKHKLCDFLNNDWVLGKMMSKQFNWTCPFPAGEYRVDKLVFHMEHFRYILPFISTSLTVKTLVKGEGHHSYTGELLYKADLHITVVQKPKVKWDKD